MSHFGALVRDDRVLDSGYSYVEHWRGGGGSRGAPGLDVVFDVLRCCSWHSDIEHQLRKKGGPD